MLLATCFSKGTCPASPAPNPTQPPPPPSRSPKTIEDFRVHPSGSLQSGAGRSPEKCSQPRKTTRVAFPRFWSDLGTHFDLGPLDKKLVIFMSNHPEAVLYQIRTVLSTCCIANATPGYRIMGVPPRPCIWSPPQRPQMENGIIHGSAEIRRRSWDSPVNGKRSKPVEPIYFYPN